MKVFSTKTAKCLVMIFIPVLRLYKIDYMLVMRYGCQLKFIYCVLHCDLLTPEWHSLLSLLLWVYFGYILNYFLMVYYAICLLAVRACMCCIHIENTDVIAGNQNVFTLNSVHKSFIHLKMTALSCRNKAAWICAHMVCSKQNRGGKFSFQDNDLTI